MSGWPWTDGTRLRQRVTGSVMGHIYLVQVVPMTACWEKAEGELCGWKRAACAQPIWSDGGMSLDKDRPGT